MKKRLTAAAVIIASGILTALTLEVDILYPLSYLSLAPYFYFLLKMTDERKSYPKLYLYGFLQSFSYYMVVYSFFLAMYPLEFMGVTKPMAALIVLFCQIGLSLLQSLSTAAVAPLFRFFEKHTALSPVLFASVWIILEWIQNFTWAGVPFLRLAISQTSFIPAMQSASIFGSLFLSFIPAFTSACFGLSFYCIKKYGTKDFSARFYPVIAIALIAANIGYGLIRIGTYVEDSGRTVKAALIQANIGSTDKWAEQTVSGIVEKHLELSRQAISESNAEIIVFSETALNFNLLEAEYTDTREKISDFAKEHAVYMLIGTFTKDGDGNSYNSVVIFYPDGTYEENPYNKRRLVPFGEFVPMESVLKTCLPFLTEMNLFDSQLTAGVGTAVAEIAGGKIGRLICFDSIYDYLTRDSVSDGAEMMILSTNDSWYLDSPAVYIHNDHAKLRAVESGKYMLRAANTGISSVIDPLGRTKAELGALEKGYVTADVVFIGERTVYSYIGNIIIPVCAVFILFEFISKIKSGRRQKKIVG